MTNLTYNIYLNTWIIISVTQIYVPWSPTWRNLKQLLHKKFWFKKASSPHLTSAPRWDREKMEFMEDLPHKDHFSETIIKNTASLYLFVICMKFSYLLYSH